MPRVLIRQALNQATLRDVPSNKGNNDRPSDCDLVVTSDPSNESMITIIALVWRQTAWPMTHRSVATAASKASSLLGHQIS